MPAAGGDAIGANRDAIEIEVLGEPFRVGEEQRRGQTIRQCRREISAVGASRTAARFAGVRVHDRPGGGHIRDRQAIHRVEQVMHLFVACRPPMR